MVLAETLVFDADQRLDEFRIDLVEIAMKAPATVIGRKGAQGFPGPVCDQGRDLPCPLQRWRQQGIQREGRADQQGKTGKKAPAWPHQPTCLPPSFQCHP